MKKIIIVLLLTAAHEMAMAQSVGIGTTTPNASAQLDITSTTKGVLIPRMTEAEKNAIPSPAQGLMVFNATTNSFQYYNGVSWVNISHSGIINGTANKVAKFNSPWGLTAAGLISDNGAGVAINTTNALANSSALLDMTSTGKGILIPRMLSAERTAIVAPATGLLVFDITTNSFWFYNGSAWAEINSVGGSSNWSVLGNNIYNNNPGNVGIGASTPFAKLTVNGDAVIADGLGIATTTPDLLNYKLDVTGNIHNTGSISVGGNFFPNYKLQVNDGSVALFNSTDFKYWAMSYSSFDNVLYFQEGSTARFVIQNGGNVGIGTTTPNYKLDVAGAIRASGNIQSQGDLSVTGSATINGGGGVAYNMLDNTNVKIARFITPQPAPFVIPAHGSQIITINLPAGFTTTPTVLVSSQHSSGGSAGELYRAILVIYDCNTTQCTGKVINTDNVAINYWVRWNLIAMQF